MQEPEPKQWTRETNWRQGFVLPQAAVQHFSFANAADAAATCVVVISHDCDLANNNLTIEPDVEVIVGRLVPNANGNFTWGKAPRTLHYIAEHAGTQVVIELISTGKRSVLKSELAKFDPDSAFTIGRKELAVLRSWLSSRYKRAAFPDAFVSRMKETKVDSKLAKALENHGELISFVYLDIHGGQNVERAKDDPYQFSIVLVFSSIDDADAATDEADALAEEVEKTVRARLRNSNVIVLKTCFAISEDDLPVSRARVLTQWRLEYMSLKADDEQPGPVDL